MELMYFVAGVTFSAIATGVIYWQSTQYMMQEQQEKTKEIRRLTAALLADQNKVVPGAVYLSAENEKEPNAIVQDIQQRDNWKPIGL